MGAMPSAGCRITEVPITFVERRRGASKLSGRVLVERDSVLIQEQNTTWELESGQTVMDFAVTELEEKIAPLRDASAARAKTQVNSGGEWFDLGLEFDRLGAREDACAAYREALSVDGDHVNAKINLGRLLHNDRVYRQAEELYQNSEIYLEKIPNAPQLISRLEEVYDNWQRSTAAPCLPLYPAVEQFLRELA